MTLKSVQHAHQSTSQLQLLDQELADATNRAQRRALTMELQQLEMPQLHTRALEAGVSPSEIDAAQASEKPTQQLISLIVDTVLQYRP